MVWELEERQIGEQIMDVPVPLTHVEVWPTAGTMLPWRMVLQPLWGMQAFLERTRETVMLLHLARGPCGGIQIIVQAPPTGFPLLRRVVLPARGMLVQSAVELQARRLQLGQRWRAAPLMDATPHLRRRPQEEHQQQPQQPEPEGRQQERQRAGAASNAVSSEARAASCGFTLTAGP